MKYSLVLIILLCSVFLGCNNKLDLEPVTQYSTNNYWKEPVHVTLALNGAYNRLQAALGNQFIAYGEARADNLVLAPFASWQTPISLLTNNLNTTLSESDWGRFYAVIKQANLIIDNIRRLQAEGKYIGVQSEYNSSIGQAFGLRALCYFYLVRIWGEVPLITESITDGSIDLRRKQDSKEDIFEQVKKDLDSALVYIPPTHSSPQKTRSLLTKGAIHAIYCDYSMWMQDYESAIHYADLLIGDRNYSLVELYNANVNYLANPSLIDNSPYAKMFTEGGSTESIFEIAFSYAEGVNSAIYGLYGSGGQYLASVNLQRKFDAADLRVIASYRTNSVIMKYFEKTDFNTVTQNDKNVILYRLADIVLLKAEALINEERREEALPLINQIRTRAGISAITQQMYLDATAEEALAFLAEERNRELCFEGRRWFDLVRTQKAIEVMEPINGLSSEDNIVWPIGQDVIRLNGLIEQNIYYR